MISPVGEILEDDVIEHARWYYIPTKTYKGFYHLIVHLGKDEWLLYYLEYLNETRSKIPDVSGLRKISALVEVKPKPVKKKQLKFFKKEFPTQYHGIRDYDIFRYIEKDITDYTPTKRNMYGFGIARVVRGNIGAIVREFIGILK